MNFLRKESVINPSITAISMAEKKQNQPNNQSSEKKMTRYDLKMQRRREQEAREKRNKLIARCVGGGIAAIVVLVIGTSVYGSWADKHGEYIKIGDHSIKREEYDFYYALSRSSFLNTYSSILSYMGVDTSSDIDSQSYTSDMTFGDYFAEQAVSEMTTTYALLDQSQTEGFTYDTTDDVTEFETNITASAEENGLTFDEYLTQAYGDYATWDKVKSYYINYITSIEFEDSVSDGIEITDDDISTYYAENKDDYDLVDYRVFTLTADVPDVGSDSDEELTDEEQEALDAQKEELTQQAMTAASSDAQEFVSNVTDEDSFIAQCKAYDTDGSYDDDDASLKSDIAKSSISPTEVGDWLYEEGRTAGDTTVIENTDSNSYEIVYFIDRKEDDAPTSDIRQIVITPQTDDSESTDTSDAESTDAPDTDNTDTAESTDTADEDTVTTAEEAKAKAEELLAQWQSGDATADSFGDIAKEESDDTYYSNNGGLREGVSDSSFTSDEINAWLFEETRQEGDTAIFEQNGSYYILYYVASGLPRYQSEIESTLRSNQLSDYVDGLTANYTVKDTRADLTYLKLEAEETETESESISESETTAESESAEG